MTLELQEIETQNQVFEKVNETLAARPQTFFSGEATPEDLFYSADGLSWEEYRDSGIEPSFSSGLDDTTKLREEFLAGAVLMGLHGPKAWNDKNTLLPQTLKPQQLRVCDALNFGHKFFGLMLPRRSAKTSSLLAWALGRCSTRERYLVAYTVATTALKARERFHGEIVPGLERVFPDAKNRPFKIVKAPGRERIVFDNGSVLQVLPPKGDKFRSDAFDLIIIDESGEADAVMSLDLMQGALSTLDTRAHAQFIFAGTASLFRKGNLLWNALEDGRKKAKSSGLLEYSAPDTTTEAEIQSWEPSEEFPESHVRELLEAAHPGLGTLTTLDIIEGNFGKLEPLAFAREYLGIHGRVGGASFLDQAKFLAGGVEGAIPELPPVFRYAFYVRPDQLSACIVAAWRVDGKAHLLVLSQFAGVDWLYNSIRVLNKRFPRIPVVHDAKGNWNLAEVEKLQRARPRPRMEPQTWPQVTTAAATLKRDLDTGNVVHYQQDELIEAVKKVVKRGTATSAFWAFGMADQTDNVGAVVAASLALRSYDQIKPRVPVTPIMGD
ncbi:hypothetical protein B0I08_101332 [Glaciihabitans tibetensis]|uniref:Phage terminase large subunit-like protein n=1 Tax=Glaciihabitans tibetensis TaxID=1266600 RepID=A0A2T0VJ04_9MICO|nr:hypothetical protein [Glaciihabitans tibetensis]PRY70204.1 hypothetical protein B0I08_101332 [Glaciihabitans tibetensis]